MGKSSKEFENVKQLIDFAINREREAQEIYLAFLGNTRRSGFRQLLISMVEMEKEHEKKLLKLKEGAQLEQIFSIEKEEDLKLNAFLVDVPFSTDMDYGDFLILVIKKEQASVELYEHLGTLADNHEIMHLFRVLSEEERKHKTWAQDRYDLEILKEN